MEFRPHCEDALCALCSFGNLLTELMNSLRWFVAMFPFAHTLIHTKKVTFPNDKLWISKDLLAQ